MGSYTKKGNYYHYQFYYNNKKYRKSLKTGDLRQAKQLAKQFEENVMRAKSVVELEQLKNKQTFAKLSTICEIYLESAKHRQSAGHKMEVATAVRNIRSLRTICGHLDQSSKCLTVGLLDQFAENRLRGVAFANLQRTRNSIESHCKKARSVFADWALKIYKDKELLLPDIKDWKKHRPVKEDHGTYRLPIERPDLVSKTLISGARLVESRNTLAVGWLLGFELALRAKESAMVKKSWFVQRGEHYGLLVIDRPSEGFKPKGQDREIAVHRDLYNEIISQSAELGESDYIIPFENYTARYNYIVRDLADWIRQLGFDKESFPKASYELRKLKGSQWYSDPALGASVAQEWLGHADIATTCKYYAALDFKREPTAPAYLKTSLT